jgi:hypothetical protein
VPAVPDLIPAVRVFPNPAGNQAIVECQLAQATDLRLSLVDLNGRILKTYGEKSNLLPGIYTEKLDLAGLAPGVYFVKIQTANGGVRTVKLMKTN